MADKKISQLTTLAQADVAVTADFLPIVDTSATETKKATPQALVQAGATGATLAVALGAVGTPSYTFTGDLNTGMWSPAADTLAVSTGGSERLRVDSSGNLGIGTTPSAWRSGARALQLGANGYVSLFEQGNGAANLTFAAYESAANTFSYRTTGDAPTIYSQVGGTHTWSNAVAGTAGNTFTFTERMRIDSSGNVGIGTASPTNTALFSRQVQIDGTTSCLTLNGTTGGGKFSLGVPSVNAFGLWDNAASAYRWFVDSSGNLGIGTSSPSVKLEVNGQIRTEAPTGGTAANWRLGTVHTVSPTSPNRTIEVDIGGTIYYLHAKTTNN